jgi:hypothetical protein
MFQNKDYAANPIPFIKNNETEGVHAFILVVEDI